VIAMLLLLLQVDLSTLSNDGARAMRERRYPEAVRAYRTLVAQDAANPMWRMNLGMALAYAGQHREAVSELTAFLKAKPQPGPAHLMLGLSRLKLGDDCAAIEPLETALRWPGRPNSIWVELGDARHGCKRWEPAAHAYAEAAKLDPGNRRLLRQLARCWWRARRYEEARPVYASVEAQYRTEPEFQFEYGDTVMRLEGAEAGLPWLEKAVAAAPNLVAARGALGRALMELGRAADALPHLIAAAPQDPALLLPLSRAYRAVGKTAEAARVEAEYKTKVGAGR
jgi:tetratricopeptide (TPR) repeat protein